MENFNEFFINLNSLSKKNSIIYISVPNAEKIKNPVKKGPFQPLEHLNTFNNSNLKELMKKNNYTPISTNRILRSMISNKNTINFFFKRIFNQMFTTNILFEKN